MLTDFQLHRVKVLSEAIKSLTIEERDCLWQAYRDAHIEGQGIDPALFSDFFPKAGENMEFDFSNLQTPDNVCAGLVQKVSRGEKITSVAQAALDSVKNEVKVEVKKEVVVEKTNFDVMLKGFSPEGKVKIIKEIKNLMNLGLKESKDTVESCLVKPVVIYKQAPTEKANELIARFKELGADVELK